MAFMIHSTSNHVTPPLVEAKCNVEPKLGMVLDARGDIGTADPFCVCMQNGPAVNGKVLAVRITPQIVFEAVCTTDPQNGIGGTVGVDAEGTGICDGDVAVVVGIPAGGNDVIQDLPALVVFK